MTLFLLPNTLFEEQERAYYLGQHVFDAVMQLDGLFAESERAGRRYLSKLKTKISFRDIPILLVNEHTKIGDLKTYLTTVKEKSAVWGLVSDCGLPCIADPGEELVREAYALGLHVQAFAGPCSIVLALQLSGCNAERFSFFGYISRDRVARRCEIKELEQKMIKYKETQIVMEAPYRNRELFLDFIEMLSPRSTLVLCANLTSREQGVVRKTVAEWKKNPVFPFEKVPALFVISL